MLRIDLMFVFMLSVYVFGRRPCSENLGQESGQVRELRMMRGDRLKVLCGFQKSGCLQIKPVSVAVRAGLRFAHDQPVAAFTHLVRMRSVTDVTSYFLPLVMDDG